MNSKSLELLEKFAPKTYIHQAHQNEISHENEIRILIEKVNKIFFILIKFQIEVFSFSHLKCKIPENSWPNERIELFLKHLSIMDSNNYAKSCGLGEREGRIYSDLVSNRNYGFSHGIGRSGDIAELQPKAIGSSILNKLTNELLIDFLKISG